MVLHQLVPCRFRDIWGVGAASSLPWADKDLESPVPDGEQNGQMAGLSNGSLLRVLSCLLYLLEDKVQTGPLEESAVGDHCGNLAGVVNIVERVRAE